MVLFKWKEDRYRVNPETGCWEWILAKCRRGYGYSWCRKTKKKIKAHRHVYEEVKGPIPDGMVLDHLCKNTSCVNPDHLEVVSVAENTRRGNSAKISFEIAESMRRQYSIEKLTLKQIAASYGVSFSLVSFVVRGDCWGGDLSATNISIDNRSRMGSSRRVLSDEDVDLIRKLKLEHVSSKVIASRFGVSVTYVNRIVSGKTRLIKGDTNASSNSTAAVN